MGKADFDRDWARLSEEVITGVKEWRLQHPKATLKEIEDAIDERLARMRARMLEDAALASTAAEWDEAAEEERPQCPHCGAKLLARGRKERRLQTHGGQRITLRRSYGACPQCGAALFPPGR
jgi:DNA-directed RNA polymerase subunit RPC12/RpoP